MQTTSQIASRLLPLSKEERESILKRFPKGRGDLSQLSHMFDGSWYVHKGDLTIDGNFISTLNLVVDGDLTVRGALSDASDEASLVVTGDLRAEHVVTAQLLVVMGSLQATGLVHGDYNDYSLEVWGPKFTARALLLTDHSAILPDACEVELEYNSNSSSGKGRAEDILVESLVRWHDEDALEYKRVTEGGKVRWFDEDNKELTADEVKELKVESSLPAPFEETVAAVMEGKPLFKAASTGSASRDWRLDRQTPAVVVSEHAASSDAKLRSAAAAHPNLPKDKVQLLAHDPDAAVRRVLVHHPLVDAAMAAEFAVDKDEHVRRQLAASAHAKDHLDTLVNDASPDVRRACASHPALTDAQRRKLLHDEVKAVRGRALRYLPVTAAWVKELRTAEDEALAAWAVEHESEVATETEKPADMADDDWKKDIFDPRAAVRVAALRRVPPTKLLPFLHEHRDRFVKDESPDIRRGLAMATRDAATLEVLSQDKDRYVRRFALDNLAAPEALLIAEATRLAKAPASCWNTSAPEYGDHMSDVQDLLAHPCLPAEALQILHRVYPRSWRMEAHRNMPLSVALERLQDHTPSLEFDAAFAEWKRLSHEPGADHAAVLTAMLEKDDYDVQSVARQNALTPLPALLAHARQMKQDQYALEDIARSPQLKAASAEAHELRELLLALEESSIDSALAGNPDLPVEVLKQVAPRAAEKAFITLWQRHGIVSDVVPAR